jgi:hypothetical protein
MYGMPSNAPGLPGNRMCWKHACARPIQRGATCWRRPAGVFQALQEVVSAVRNARAEYGVELGRRIPAQLIVAEAGLSSALQTEMPVLCSLAKLDEAEVNILWICCAVAKGLASSSGCSEVLR